MIENDHKVVSGLRIDLSPDRSVSGAAGDDGEMLFMFVSNGVETHLRLSHEAIQAVMQLYVSIRAAGLSA